MQEVVNCDVDMAKELGEEMSATIAKAVPVHVIWPLR
jgi:hypothetical protein